MHLLLSLALFFSLAALASPLQCYSCVGALGLGDDCFTPSSKHIVDCKNGCFKAFGEVSGKKAVARTCAVTKVEQDECHTGDYDFKVTRVTATLCSCQGDLCNSAIGVGATFITTAALLVSAFTF
ncbi:unnamed protein product [Bursaphelenchus xylophilus]|uniref:(pine wood nematode) hypothetical protein n=1 Tax=Bursaphelenchus xylophilus TaxID=6326 RepID=A0A7I8WXY2_BURXY|nr:unnamed protein product [Bursaphelenchus xylophilus]CAG9100803.1 unnamed protein product [Bursaphelenchus xylophilus]